VFIRQTNIMWAVFVLGTSTLRDYQSAKLPNHSPVYFPTTLLQLPRALLGFVSAVLINSAWLLRRYWAYALVFLGFTVFLILNGGVVVGDRSNHVAVLHVPQLLYCVAFMFATSPESWKPRMPLQFPRLSYLLLSVIILVLMVWVIYSFTYAHPFLLADNRHLTFYIWKNIFRRHPACKYALVPLYFYAGLACRASLGSRWCWLWILIFSASVAAMLIPSPLMELRYYLLPSLFLMLHQEPSARVSILTALGYTAVNAVVIGVFLFRPFTWPDGSIARFMW